MRLTWSQRRWMRRVGYRLAAIYEACGIDYTTDYHKALSLSRQSRSWCPLPRRYHRQGWTVFYTRDLELIGVWPARLSQTYSY